jgi:hypothetical protein
MPRAFNCDDIQQAADFFGGLFFVSQQMDKPEIV